MFKKHRSKPAALPSPVTNTTNINNTNDNNSNSGTKGGYVAPTSPSSPLSPISKATLQFHCQLADGSPTGFVSGFSNVKELYQKIAECFDFPPSEILFCTLNTYKIDMKKLLGGQIGLEDFIFAHRKGRPKEIELIKSEEALGLTITDNGAGYAFIKRIKEGSIIDNIPHIQVGDHIEKLDGENMIGKRHFEVARFLKDIPLGTSFTIRLIEPLKSGFNSIAPKSGNKIGKKAGFGTGRGTLRFKSSGTAEIEERDDVMDAGVDKINAILESFLGINDEELASKIWDLAVGKTNSMEFAEAIDDSDLEVFGFTDDLIIELWGAVTDARDRRF